jgi:hypothetical protein
MQILGGRFWGTMGDFQDVCVWGPLVPTKMLLDGLMIVPDSEQAGRHGALISRCLLQLLLSAHSASRMQGASPMVAVCKSMSCFLLLCIVPVRAVV